MNILVIGGAGYVGSSVCAHLLDQKHRVWVLDELSTGRRELLLPGLAGFTEGRLGDRGLLEALFRKEKFDGVMHFAARALVGESFRKPEEYYENNVMQTETLLEVMAEVGVKRLVFSSTCAIFGDPGEIAIDESLPKNPINPYGKTKLQAERLIESFAKDRGIQAIALRYFNAAGADLKGRVGEWHEPETHLIPRILRSIRQDRAVEIYGLDYPTSDGTCVRDYVHVSDLAQAHESALERLRSMPEGRGLFEAYNLGSEQGYSVIEIIEACATETGKDVRVVEKPPRPGDPPRLVADSRLASARLGFKPKQNLESIVRSAWAWEQAQAKRGVGIRRAVFLDRDGTINEDPGYLSHPDQLKLLPGVPEALAELKRAGFELIVVSNQSGVGRGLIGPDMLDKIHARLDEFLRPSSASIDHFELCVHRPEEACACRKPRPKLLIDGARARGVDLSSSYMVGDKSSDLGAGLDAGVRASILVRTGEGKATESKLQPGDAAFIADSLKDAVKWILDDLRSIAMKTSG